MLQSCNADDRNHILCNEMSEWGVPYPDVRYDDLHASM